MTELVLLVFLLASCKAFIQFIFISQILRDTLRFPSPLQIKKAAPQSGFFVGGLIDLDQGHARLAL